ncbi:MAG: AsnC family transcriptional regulator [Betaproteobacteria bacterium]|nr:AsnC family transcriptional regulator [Betaproteobacteria bacterium]MDH5221978.1 AsnC family transcriptional regulator [Betaproteobacteria bacterium]MDH5350149.1 AsnC family transcriptional regulator [Betaproteobacteria bacterium]
MLDATGFRLLNAWQRDFPLVPRPFARIAADCGLDEDDVLARFAQLRSRGLIDRIAPVFRPNTVGASTLAAMRVPPERLARVAAQVSAHAGVNHNYERENPVNLWFVAAASSPAALQWTLSCIEHETGLPVLRLPLLEEFHIDLGFDLRTHAAPRAARDEAVAPLGDEERSLAARLAAGLPLAQHPFAAFGLPEAELIGTLRRWLDNGVVRRIGAVVRHRRLGYEANAMVVWDVPEGEASAAGRRLAGDSAVTLCYRRARALPDWRYNLYCMVHGRARDPVAREIERLSARHGLGGYAREVLFSTRCFSQRAARYG